MKNGADICMIVHNDVTADSRVLKEAASLAAHGYRVVVVGISLTGQGPQEIKTEAGFTIWRARPPLLLPARSPNRTGLFLRLMLALPASMVYLRRVNARVYHAHDFTGLLHLALTGIWRRPVVYDSHELFFDRPLPDLAAPVRWALYRMRGLEKRLARRAACVITINDTIADRLAETLGIPRPVVVRNAVDLRDLAPRAADFPVNGRVIAHTGRLVPGRHLHELIIALKYLPADVSLVYMGEGPLGESLLAYAEAQGVKGRFAIVPPVPPEAVSLTLAQADVAAVLTTTEGLNNNFALPNKFFEAIAAGVPLVTGPNVEIAALMQQYQMGVICDPSNPEALAQAINTVLQPENLARFRANARQARAVLNWEQEEGKLIAVYEAILGR